MYSHKPPKSINIRPDVNIISIFPHLNYKAHYALAEFVDNAIDSYLKNEKELRDVAGTDYQLTVKIDFNTTDNKIVIRDNAAGIHTKDFVRAFKPASIPPDTSRLSEFGMGMKTAACWFTKKWEVSTSALDESIQRTILFDIDNISKNKTEDLPIAEEPCREHTHYTVLTLKEVGKRMPKTNGIGKIKRHLASIYRQYIRQGTLRLFINEEELAYDTPKILHAPYYDNSDGQLIEWKKEVDFDFGSDEQGTPLKAKGFVALMEKMSSKNSGFALFRRGRVIEGSADDHEGFRPTQILGSVGSHRYKRLFGELHLEGFKVSHTKDGFQWGDNMDAFLDLLKEELTHESSILILKQAEYYRVRESDKDYSKKAKVVVNKTIATIREALPKEINQLRTKPIIQEEIACPLRPTQQSYYKTLTCELYDITWKVHIACSYDDTMQELFEVGDHFIPANIILQRNCRDIGIRLSLKHPFMVTFAGDKEEVITPVLRIVVAFGIAEVLARETQSEVGEVRYSMNTLLKGELSKL